jgi:glycerol-3-phosphate acyltransferase PlsY
MEYVVAALLGYLLGSIPFAALVAARHGVDLRAVGDGNPGAWNALTSSAGAARRRRSCSTAPRAWRRG